MTKGFNMIKLLSIMLLIVGCASTPQNDFSNISGKDHSNKEISHRFSDSKATVVIFLSAYCPCSNSHVPIIKDLAKSFPEYKFIGVHSNANEKRNRALKYFTENNFGFEIIHDQSGDIARKFGAVKTPHVFIINAKGENIYTGSVTDASMASSAKKFHLEAALKNLRIGKLPETPKRKTLGCYIQLNEDKA